MPEIRKTTLAEWREEAVKLFGPDELKWQFVCPVCGHVASVADWKAVGASSGEVAFSCVGRHIEGSKPAFEKNGKGPCTYTGGGLFRLNPVEVLCPDGSTIQAFEFAKAEAKNG